MQIRKSTVDSALYSSAICQTQFLCSLFDRTFSPAYEFKYAKETTHCKWVLKVTELFDIAVNDFDAKKNLTCKQVLIVRDTSG